MTERAKPIDIQTDKGKVRCSQFETHLEGLGIPYAAPPLGDLRLRAPIEHAAWTEVRDATRFGPASLQSKTEYDGAQGSEDCLYLNVYRPGAANGAPLPVMMWLHGGGFVNGSGNAFYGAFPGTDCKRHRGDGELPAWAAGLACACFAFSRSEGPFDGQLWPPRQHRCPEVDQTQHFRIRR